MLVYVVYGLTLLSRVVSVFAARLQPSEAAQCGSYWRVVFVWVSVTFVYCVETAQDTAIVAMDCDQETVPKLPNGTISNDLE